MKIRLTLSGNLIFISSQYLKPSFHLLVKIFTDHCTFPVLSQYCLIMNILHSVTFLIGDRLTVTLNYNNPHYSKKEPLLYITSLQGQIFKASICPALRPQLIIHNELFCQQAQLSRGDKSL